MENLGIIIVDMQEDFLREEKDEKNEVIRNHLDFLQRIRHKKIPIFVSEYLNHQETHSRIKKELENHNAKYFEKSSNGAFYNYFIHGKRVSFTTPRDRKYRKKFIEKKETGLNYELQNQDILNLIITGINKYSCVLRTAEQAVKEGYNVITCDDLMNQKRFDNLLKIQKEWYEKETKNYKTLKELLQNL